ncbi:hypothetical protein [Imhoffiella purpurea]|uniref:hypothetical protein n=1 Tax=Imhoffiella purpurea TaxID=1249627 RepID=UPI0012FE186D|nr:hypothetical protein [Imhoffiella purpurea]
MNKERWIEIGALGAGTVILAVALSKVDEAFGWPWLIAGALGSFSILVLYSLSVSVGVRSKYEQQLEVLSKSIQALEYKEKPDWLYPTHQINEIEESIKAKDIWVVSPDLENDTADADVIPIVKSNAKNGVRYTYVVPDNELIDARIKELIAVFKGIRSKPQIIKMPEKEFFLMTITHITVYNPKGEGGKPGRVFLELPVNGRGWWIEMCRGYGSPYIGRIGKIIEHELEAEHANNAPHPTAMVATAPPASGER